MKQSIYNIQDEIERMVREKTFTFECEDKIEDVFARFNIPCPLEDIEDAYLQGYVDAMQELYHKIILSIKGITE